MNDKVRIYIESDHKCNTGIDMSASQERKIQQLEDDLEFYESFADWIEMASGRGDTGLTIELFELAVDRGEWQVGEDE